MKASLILRSDALSQDNYVVVRIDQPLGDELLFIYDKAFFEKKSSETKAYYHVTNYINNIETEIAPRRIREEEAQRKAHQLKEAQARDKFWA